MSVVSLAFSLYTLMLAPVKYLDGYNTRNIFLHLRGFECYPNTNNNVIVKKLMLPRIPVMLSWKC